MVLAQRSETLKQTGSRTIKVAIVRVISPNAIKLSTGVWSHTHKASLWTPSINLMAVKGNLETSAFLHESVTLVTHIHPKTLI